MSDVTVTTVDPATLLDQLAAGREKLREERHALKPKLAEAERLHREATETRQRVRKASARFLKRVRQKAAAAAKPVLVARAELSLQQEELNRAFAELSADRERFAADSQTVRAQLQQSWELHTAQQQQFAAERQSRDAELSTLFRLLEAREADVTAREEKARHERKAADADLAAIRAEVAGLDQRVLNVRLVLQELEQQRAKQMVERVTGSALAFDPIPLHGTGDIPPSQLSALQIREDDLQREQKALALARRELEKLAEHLTDQRQVLAEQFNTFAAAKQAWQTAETHTVDELEALAKAVERREEMHAAREAGAERTEENRRERERELWKYQTTLDRWHTSLTEREMQFQADRAQAEVGLAVRRGLVADREAGLDFVCQKWEAEHARVREQLLGTMATYQHERQACGALTAECERMKRQTQEQAAKLAAWLLAAEQQQQEEAATDPANAKSARRVRALRKKWESRFGRMLRQIDARLKSLLTESAAVVARHGDLQRLAAEVTERQRQQQMDDRLREKGRAQAEKMPLDEPMILSIADARRQRADAEMQRLRTAADLAASALLDADAKHDIIRLKPAGAA